MKTIEVSDKDYEILMELSKELQTQDNHGQAFPYFWNPSGIEHVPDEQGDIVTIIVDCEQYTPEDFAEYDPELWNKFRDYWNESDEEGEETVPEVYPKNFDWESEWMDEIKDKYRDAYVYHEKKERVVDHNMSIFYSDVKNFCASNSHHLGNKPSTYARTSWRMPKMKNLMECLLRINKTVPKECVNHEALRFREDR
jgi:hypothetical protein